MKCIVRSGYMFGQQVEVSKTQKVLKMYGPGEEVEIADGSPLPHQLEVKPAVTPPVEEGQSPDDSEADSNE